MTSRTGRCPGFLVGPLVKVGFGVIFLQFLLIEVLSAFRSCFEKRPYEIALGFLVLFTIVVVAGISLGLLPSTSLLPSLHEDWFR